MVKMIITAPKDFDIEGFCEVAVILAGAGYENKVLFPRWDVDTSGKPIHRYEIDGCEIDFKIAAALYRLSRIYPKVEIHCKNDLDGENYTTPKSRFTDVGKGLFESKIVDTLGGAIHDATLNSLYHDVGRFDLFTDIVNEHAARAHA